MKAVVALLLLGLVAGSYALKCYKCTGTGCEDEYAKPAGDESECLIDDGGCSKTKGLTKVLGVKIATVVRLCGGSLHDNKNCKKPQKVNAIVGKSTNWSCSCKGELCNGAGHVTLTFPLLAAVIAKFVL